MPTDDRTTVVIMADGSAYDLAPRQGALATGSAPEAACPGGAS